MALVTNLYLYCYCILLFHQCFALAKNFLVVQIFSTRAYSGWFLCFFCPCFCFFCFSTLIKIHILHSIQHIQTTKNMLGSSWWEEGWTTSTLSPTSLNTSPRKWWKLQTEIYWRKIRLYIKQPKVRQITNWSCREREREREEWFFFRTDPAERERGMIYTI